MSLLNQVRGALVQELDLPAVFCGVVEAIAETYDYSQVSAYLLEGEELVLQHQVGYDRVIERIPASEGVYGPTIRTRLPLLLEDVRNDPDLLGAIEGLTSEICVPVFDEGEAVGFINVESRGGVKLTPKDLEVVVALGEHVSVALSRAKLHTLVRNSEERFRTHPELLRPCDPHQGRRHRPLPEPRDRAHARATPPEETGRRQHLRLRPPRGQGEGQMAFAEGLEDTRASSFGRVPLPTQGRVVASGWSRLAPTCSAIPEWGNTS